MEDASSRQVIGTGSIRSF